MGWKKVTILLFLYKGVRMFLERKGFLENIIVVRKEWILFVCVLYEADCLPKKEINHRSHKNQIFSHAKLTLGQ